MDSSLFFLIGFFVFFIAAFVVSKTRMRHNAYEETLQLDKRLQQTSQLNYENKTKDRIIAALIIFIIVALLLAVLPSPDPSIRSLPKIKLEDPNLILEWAKKHFW